MNNLSPDIVQQVELDIERRTLNGTYIYFLGWLAIGVGTDFYITEPSWFYAIASTLFLLGITRVICYYFSSTLKSYSHNIWWWLLRANVLLPSLIFSTMFGLSMYVPEFSDIFLYVFLAIFAFISNGTLTYALDRSLYICYLAANTLVPIVLVFAFAESVEAHIQAGMLVVYSIYMVFQGQQVNKEYMQKLEQESKLRELSVLDGLTGIYNRRYFDQYLETSWQQHQKSGEQLAVVIIDIDLFKEINDRYGHPAGDETIKQMALLISNVFHQDTCAVARIGGEEFAVVLQSFEQTDLEIKADELRQQTENMKIEHGNDCFQITISIGIGIANPSVPSKFSELMTSADKALYFAKSSGRNCVKVHVLQGS